MLPHHYVTYILLHPMDALVSLLFVCVGIVIVPFVKTVYAAVYVSILCVILYMYTVVPVVRIGLLQAVKSMDRVRERYNDEARRNVAEMKAMHIKKSA
jgi:hypothetical protein